MRKNKYHWDVEVPKEGPLNREEAWAALSSIKTKLDLIGYRITGDDMPPSESVLEEEIEIFRAAQQHYSKLIKELEMDVLDKLATIKPDEPVEDTKFPKDLVDLLENYYGDIARWERKESGNYKVVLALALLEDSGVDTDTISKLITQEFDPRSKYSDVWDCPQCDDDNLGKVGEDVCRRCYGWGYVFGDEPDADQYDWSEKGRAALNRGEVWTDDQEGAEQTRIREEQARSKD